MSNAAVYRISKPSLSLIAYCHHCIEPLVDRNMQKKLGYVTRTKYLVHGCEMGCPLLRIKVWRKYTSRHALPPQKLASTAWPSSAATAASAATSTTTSRVCTHLCLFFGFLLVLSLSFSAFCFGYDYYHIIRGCGVVLEEEEGGGGGGWWCFRVWWVWFFWVIFLMGSDIKGYIEEVFKATRESKGLTPTFSCLREANMR